MAASRTTQIPPSSRAASAWGTSLQPLGVGLVAIFVVAAAVFVFGDSRVESSVVRNIGSQHERDLRVFSQGLHQSGIELDGPNVQSQITEIARTATFDADVQQSLFGLRALRMDIYSLDGTPIYSTEGLDLAPALSGAATNAFISARNGQFTSYLRGESESKAELGAASEMLQSFTLIRSVPPGSVESGSALMVASITTDVGEELASGYATLWSIVGVFFFGSLAILAVVYWASVRSQARLRRANDALAEQYVAVRESRERMIEAADTTKRAIAEELHGTVQTRIFSLWSRLNRSIGEIEGSARVELAAIADELDDLREHDIRGLSHRLHPSIVRVGAVPALRSLCARMSGDLQVSLKVDDAATALEPVGASPIPEPIRLAVFRIAELAIGNTIKHADASRCKVSWQYLESSQQLVLSIEDDGVGFDPDDLTASEGGLGIVNIQDYTDAIDGKAALKSQPGWGTSLTVTIPFERLESTALSERISVVQTSSFRDERDTGLEGQKAA